MTCVVHHGPPGSYKTFALVQRVIIPALIEGRVVVTNIRGVDLESIAKAYKVELPDTARLVYVEPDIAGYKHISKFFEWVPAGALICMDEGQRVYPTSERNFRHLDISPDIPLTDIDQKPVADTDGNIIYRPYNLENAFDQHRHYNWDIYISTTNIGKINGEIRKVVEWAYRHRNNSGLLPWYKNTWSEFRHDAEQTGKSISHYSGAPKKYKADPRAFSCYKSTATGKAKESSENISIFRDPKLRTVLAVGGLAILYILYMGVQKAGEIQGRLNPTPEESLINNQIVGTSHTPPAGQNSHLPTDIHSRNSLSQNGPVFSRLVSPPYAGMPIYYTGKVNETLWFEIKICQDEPCTTSIRHNDLEALDLEIVSVLDSFVKLQDNATGAYIIAGNKPVSSRPYLPPERSYNAMPAPAQWGNNNIENPVINPVRL